MVLLTGSLLAGQQGASVLWYSKIADPAKAERAVVLLDGTCI